MTDRREGGAESIERPTVPEWLVERLAVRDLPPGQTERVREQLEKAGELERLRAIEVSNRAILDAHPPAAVSLEVRRRLACANERAPRSGPLDERPPSLARYWPWSVLGPGAAAVALLSLLFVSTERGPITSDSQTSVRLKGLEPQLVIYKKTAAGAVRLDRPALAAAGDLVQLAYVAAGRRYGVVASIDSTGVVTLHLPEAPGSAAMLVPQSETPLPHAFELDDAPGAERFMFVTADHPFHVDAVISALREGATLPPDLSIHQVHLEKNGHE
jgi:hypothetical protein